MSDKLHVATRKGLVVVEKGASGWKVATTHFFGDNVTLTRRDPRDGKCYAALNHGHFGVKLHRSDDGGATWEEITAPAYPPKPDDVEEIDPIRKMPIPWSLQDIWALEPGSADEPGTLWCGTIPGGLFKSTDCGATWAINEPLWFMPERKMWMGGGKDLPGLHSICIHPDNPQHLLIAVSTGGVWQTLDGGQSWEVTSHGLRADYLPPEGVDTLVMQDAHRVAQCPAEPDKLWLQHHNGIFKSTNGGRQWTEIEKAGPSTFGFGVVVHPEHGDTAWFVPGIKDEKRVPVDGKLVVTRTRDGGKTFDVLSKGLPQEHCHDIVYRHALALDASGDRLAFGTTTGNLYVSEDQGDSWQCVSNHLAMVHGVEFV